MNSNGMLTAVPPAATSDGWLSRERILAIGLLAATAGALYLCYRLTVPFLPALTWAVTFAIVAAPMHRWIRRRIENRDAAAAIAVAVVAVALIVPGLLIAQRMLNEAAVGVDQVQADGQAGDWETRLASVPYIGSWLAWAQQHIDVEQVAADGVRKLTEEIGPFLTGSLVALVQLLLMLFILYYAFRDHHLVVEMVRSLMPLTEGETDRLFTNVADTIQATVFGTVVVAILQGVLGGLAFWWLGLPAPLLWGVIMAALAVIPWLGAFVIWGPAAVLLAVQGEWSSATFLAIWGAVVVGLSDNWLYPIIVGGKLRLHTLPTFIAIIGGLTVFGAAGVILGPVVLAVTIALLEV